jgi:hypothetical protein
LHPYFGSRVAVRVEIRCQLGIRIVAADVVEVPGVDVVEVPGVDVVEVPCVRFV